jgi:hypothetical protein
MRRAPSGSASRAGPRPRRREAGPRSRRRARTTCRSALPRGVAKSRKRERDPLEGRQSPCRGGPSANTIASAARKKSAVLGAEGGRAPLRRRTSAAASRRASGGSSRQFPNPYGVDGERRRRGAREQEAAQPDAAATAQPVTGDERGAEHAPTRGGSPTSTSRGSTSHTRVDATPRVGCEQPVDGDEERQRERLRPQLQAATARCRAAPASRAPRSASSRPPARANHAASPRRGRAARARPRARAAAHRGARARTARGVASHCWSIQRAPVRSSRPARRRAAARAGRCSDRRRARPRCPA